MGGVQQARLQGYTQLGVREVGLPKWEAYQKERERETDTLSFGYRERENHMIERKRGE